MMKRFAALALCLALFFAPAAAASAAVGGLEKTREYAGQFSDIAGRWYEAYIADLYEYGFVEGRGGGLAAPEAPVLEEELIALAARLRAAYYGEEIPAADGPWYEPYVAYARANGLGDDAIFARVGYEATRGEAARILAAALPAEALEAVNAAKTYFDVVPGDRAYDAVTALTRAGVVEGYPNLSFGADASITRAEAFAMLDRMVDPDKRVREATYNTPPAPDTPAGEQDADIGDHVVFVDNGWSGVSLDLNRRDGGFTLRVTLAADTYLLMAGEGEVRGEYMSCILGDRVIYGDGALPAVTGEDLAALTFRYTGGRTLTLLAATKTDGTRVVYNDATGTIDETTAAGVVTPFAYPLPGYALAGGLAIGTTLVAEN